MNADRKVLLVEDEALVAALAVDALEELGYQTIEATTAKAALEIAAGATQLRVRDRRRRLARWPRRCAGARVAQAARRPADHHRDRLRQVAPRRAPAHSSERTAVLNKPYDIAQLQAAIGRSARSLRDAT